MDLEKTVFIKGTTAEFLKVMRELGNRERSDSGKPLIVIPRNTEVTPLRAEVHFRPLKEGRALGRIRAIGAGDDVEGRLIEHTMLVVTYSESDVESLGPTWRMIFGELKKRRMVRRAFSGSIDPMTLLHQPSSKPEVTAGWDEWFAWRESERMAGRTVTLRQIAAEKSNSYGYVRTQHSEWKKEHGL